MRLILSILALITTGASAYAQINSPMGVRLSDLSRYQSSQHGDSLKTLETKMSTQLESLHDKKIENFYGLYPTNNQVVLSNDYVTGEALYFVRFKAKSRIRLFGSKNNDSDKIQDIGIGVVSFTYSGGSLSVTGHRSIPKESLNLQGQVSLVDRKVLFTDANNDFKMIFPVGVGSFDEGVLNPGVVTLLTPRFKSAVLTKDSTISSRSKPRYFNDKPFIRLIDGETRETTAIGFHTEINENFYRGFDSHGCMRLRDNDLYLLHDLVKFVQTEIPITVSYRIIDELDHPAPKVNRVYKTVRNGGTAENPKMVLDRDNLVQVVYREKEAPHTLLIDEEDDHYKNKYQYEALDTYQKQRAEHRKMCAEKFAPQPGDSDEVLSDKQKEIEECQKEGARRLSIKDKIYRWWVH